MSKQANSQEQLKALLLERSLRIGDFVLAGGARSSYYIDARRTTMSAEGQRLTGEVLYDLIEEVGWDVSHVGGLTLGADPIAYAVAHHSAGRKKPLDGFTVRKEAKKHGTRQQIEGGLPADGCVAIVDDTLTTGASAEKAIGAVWHHGAMVAGVLCLVDREEGARKRLAGLGLPLVAAFTGKELVAAAVARSGG